VNPRPTAGGQGVAGSDPVSPTAGNRSSGPCPESSGTAPDRILGSVDHDQAAHTSSPSCRGRPWNGVLGRFCDAHSGHAEPLFPGVGMWWLPVQGVAEHLDGLASDVGEDVAVDVAGDRSTCRQVDVRTRRGGRSPGRYGRICLPSRGRGVHPGRWPPSPFPRTSRGRGRDQERGGGHGGNGLTPPQSSEIAVSRSRRCHGRQRTRRDRQPHATRLAAGHRGIPAGAGVTRTAAHPQADVAAAGVPGEGMGLVAADPTVSRLIGALARAATAAWAAIQPSRPRPVGGHGADLGEVPGSQNRADGGSSRRPATVHPWSRRSWTPCGT
jgi:hypothetical protein